MRYSLQCVRLNADFQLYITNLQSTESEALYLTHSWKVRHSYVLNDAFLTNWTQQLNQRTIWTADQVSARHEHGVDFSVHAHLARSRFPESSVFLQQRFFVVTHYTMHTKYQSINQSANICKVESSSSMCVPRDGRLKQALQESEY